MKHLALGIYFSDKNGDVYSKRLVGSNWSINVEQDLMKYHAIDVMDEIATILVENLKLQVTPDIIKEMLSEIKERNE